MIGKREIRRKKLQDYAIPLSWDNKEDRKRLQLYKTVYDEHIKNNADYEVFQEKFNEIFLGKKTKRKMEMIDLTLPQKYHCNQTAKKAYSIHSQNYLHKEQHKEEEQEKDQEDYEDDDYKDEDYKYKDYKYKDDNSEDEDINNNKGEQSTNYKDSHKDSNNQESEEDEDIYQNNEENNGKIYNNEINNEDDDFWYSNNNNNNCGEDQRNDDETDKCFLCNWEFPREMNHIERHVHINKCADGEGQKDKVGYLRTKAIILLSSLESHPNDQRDLHSEALSYKNKCIFCNEYNYAKTRKIHEIACAQKYLVNNH